MKQFLTKFILPILEKIYYLLPFSLHKAIKRRFQFPKRPSDYFLKAEYLHLQKKLQKIPRYTRGSVQFGDWILHYVDAPALLSSIRILILNGWNDFSFPNDHPTILDCGANIGISVLRYKQLFPKAKIIAFEPDKEICEVLRLNLKNNNVDDVTVIEAAVWIENGKMLFGADGADGSHLMLQEQFLFEETLKQKYEVKTIDLRDYLEGVNFAKIDIEGAESEVVSHCLKELSALQSLIIEFHLNKEKPCQLAEILDGLCKIGFITYVNSINWVNLTDPTITNLTDDKIASIDQYHILAAYQKPSATTQKSAP
jgi:FkbM family methyltransferase